MTHLLELAHANRVAVVLVKLLERLVYELLLLKLVHIYCGGNKFIVIDDAVTVNVCCCHHCHHLVCRDFVAPLLDCILYSCKVLCWHIYCSQLCQVLSSSKHTRYIVQLYKTSDAGRC